MRYDILIQLYTDKEPIIRATTDNGTAYIETHMPKIMAIITNSTIKYKCKNFEVK